MKQDQPEAIRQVTRDLKQLAQPLREKRWEPILRYLGDARVVIKGTPHAPAYLPKILGVKTVAVRDLEIVVEDLLESRTEAQTFDIKVRVAVLGRRIEGNTPDGVIMDCQLAFSKGGDRWQLDLVAIDCPPEWAQWNNRPNSRAPIHYGDAAWWERHSATQTSVPPRRSEDP